MVYRYYEDYEDAKVPYKKESGGRESSLVLSKDKKSIILSYKYSSEGDESFMGYKYTKDNSGNLLIATLLDDSTYSTPVIVTKYKSDAEMLKAIPNTIKKYESEDIKIEAAYAAKDKISLTKPVSSTNKLRGFYISTDKKWEIDFSAYNISISHGDMNNSYDISKVTNEVKADKRVTSTYVTTYYDENGNDVNVSIKVVSDTRQKIVSVTVSNFKAEDATAISKATFNYSTEHLDQ